MFLDPKNWTAAYYPAPEFNLAGFQSRLDQICGKARGQSKVKLVWGGDQEEPVPRQISDLGVGLGYEMRGKYLTRVKDKAEKVRIRRFIFLEWQAPEITGISEDQFVQMGGGALFRPQTFNEINHKGDWEIIYVVADHSQCPKEICDSLEYPCHGGYRKPDERDLNKFMRITGAIQDAALNIDPFSPMSQEILDRLTKRQVENEQKRKAETEAEQDAYYEDRKKTRRKLSFSG